MTNYIRWLLFSCLFILAARIDAQKIVKKINKKISPDIVRSDMMYLASDQLQGRKTGEPGNQAAAAYIAEVFRNSGVKIVPGMSDYFQSIPFQKYIPAHTGTMNMAGIQFSVGNNLVILDGGSINQKIEAVYADFGWIDQATQRNAALPECIKRNELVVPPFR